MDHAATHHANGQQLDAGDRLHGRNVPDMPESRLSPDERPMDPAEEELDAVLNDVGVQSDTWTIEGDAFDVEYNPETGLVDLFVFVGGEGVCTLPLGTADMIDLVQGVQEARSAQREDPDRPITDTSAAAGIGEEREQHPTLRKATDWGYARRDPAGLRNIDADDMENRINARWAPVRDSIQNRFPNADVPEKIQSTKLFYWIAGTALIISLLVVICSQYF